VATLTEADIEQAMARAVAILRERSQRPQELMELPDTVETALASLTEDGWMQVGSIVNHGGDRDYHVWLNVQTGAGRLRRWPR